MRASEGKFRLLPTKIGENGARSGSMVSVAAALASSGQSLGNPFLPVSQQYGQHTLQLCTFLGIQCRQSILLLQIAMAENKATFLQQAQRTI